MLVQVSRTIASAVLVYVQITELVHTYVHKSYVYRGMVTRILTYYCYSSI